MNAPSVPSSPTSPSLLPAVLLMLVCTAVWGSVFPIAKPVLDEMHPYSLAFWRFAVASVCLLPYLFFMKRSGYPPLAPVHFLLAACVGIIGAGGLNLGLFTGLQLTSAMNGALIMSLSPVFTALMASAVSRKPPAAGLIFSLITGLMGVALVITRGDINVLINIDFNRGDLMIFAGVLCWSFYTLATPWISRWMPVMAFTLLSMIAGALTIGLACLFSVDAHPWQEMMSLPSHLQLSALYIGMFATVMGYLLWNNGVRTLGAPNAALFTNFIPVFSALFAEMLGQPLTDIQLVGMLIVMGGLLTPVLVKRWQKRQQRLSDTPA